MEKRISKLKFLFALIITLVIFYVIFTRVNVAEVVRVLSRSNLGYLFLAFFVTLFFPIIEARRWQNILISMGYNLHLIESMKIVMGAFPISSITPSKSGDMIRSLYLKDRIPISKTIGSVLAERVLDLLALSVISLVGLLLYAKSIMLLTINSIILFSTISIILLSRMEIKVFFWGNKLNDLLLSMKILSKNSRLFLATISYTFLTWLLSVVQVMLFFMALKINVPVLFTMANIPIAILIGLIPITIGGMGTRDSAIIYLFSPYAAPSELLGVGILFSVFRYLILSLLGIPFLKKLVMS